MSHSTILSIDPQGEFPSDPRDYLFLLAFQILKRQEVRSDRLLKPLGISVAAWRALLIVDRLQPCTMNELARMSAVERTTLTRTVDQLVAEGLAERSTPPDDRRRVQVSLTPRGAEVLDTGKQLVYADQHRAAEGLEDADLRQTARTLEGMVARLVDDPEALPAILSVGRPGEADEA